MESTTSSEVLVCQTCGNEGFSNAFVYCVKCLGFVIHRYCLNVIPKTTTELVIWLCEDCKPLGPYKFILPKNDPSGPDKEDPTNSAVVNMVHSKKNQKMKQKRRNKKRKIAHLLPEKVEVSLNPNHECVSPIEETLMNSNLGTNKITRCVVLGLAKVNFHKRFSKSDQLENCFPLKESDSPKNVKKTPRRKKLKKKTKKKKKIVSLAAKKDMDSCPQEATEPNLNPNPESVSPAAVNAELENSSPFRENVKTETEKSKQKTEETANPVDISLSDSSCTDATGKDEEKCEVNQSDSLSTEKELNKKIKDNDGQIETENNMTNEENMRVDRDCVDASQSVDFVDNFQYLHQPARPVLKPVWRGNFNIIESDYDLFKGYVGHLSSKACFKVCEEANKLPLILNLQMQPKTDLWPRSFLESQPSDENIALYFFPGTKENEIGFEQLVNDMIDEDLAMKATATNAELLVFTSRVLPQPFWTFLGNYYLWGVFRGKKNDSSENGGPL